eukprot:GFUD01028517.1.p1 GENE.GFUD01028517.1~~GFUD01028517.1.p1  ORF type:complete len:338 (+),score=74.42 GFUD01028517.1:59-1072(+)
MDVQVLSSGDTPLSYLTSLLSTLQSMRQTSSYPDCYLTSCDGTPTPVHLALLSLAWPSVKHLLPHSDGHCSCQCCVQVIAVTADLETVQMVLQLLYTGRTDVVGVVEEEKIKELLQVLGLEWDLEKVSSVEEVNNNEGDEVNSLSGIHVVVDKTKVSVYVDENVFEERVTDPSLLQTECKLCGLKFANKLNWQRHLSRVHFREELKERLNNLSAVEHSGTARTIDEMKMENGLDVKINVKMQSLTCKLCKTVCCSSYKLKRHLATSHFKEQINQGMPSGLKCNLCNREFKLRNQLIIHVGCSHNRSYEFYKEYLKNETASEADVNIASVVDEMTQFK